MRTGTAPRRTHRILWVYVALACATGFALVAAFHAVELHRIDAWARTALDLAREEARTRDGSVSSPGKAWQVDSVDDTWGVPMAVTVGEGGAGHNAPWEASVYYGAHRDDWEGLGVRLLRSDDRAVYAQRGVTAPGLGDVLYTVDVTAPLTVLEQSTAALTALVAGASAVLVAGGVWVMRRLDAADARTRAFFANASHELKTPLAAIRGYAAALGDGTVDACEAVAVLERESARMGDLVDSVLALSKVDAGAAVPDPSPVDLRETAYAALQDLEAEARGRGVALEPSMDGPVLVTGDDAMLFSAVSNMVSNAVRHAATHVSVTAVRNGCRTVLSVADDGTPAPGELEGAFERFRSSTEGGCGIGLALAREYARIHGGDVTLSREDGATVCRLTLPHDPENPTAAGGAMSRATRTLSAAAVALVAALSLAGCGGLPQEVPMERPVVEGLVEGACLRGTVVARSPRELVVAREGLVNEPALSDSPTVFGNQTGATEGKPDFTVVAISPDTPCTGPDGAEQGIYDVEPGQKVDVEYSVSEETAERSFGELPTVRESRVVNTATSVAVK